MPLVAIIALAILSWMILRFVLIPAGRRSMTRSQGDERVVDAVLVTFLNTMRGIALQAIVVFGTISVVLVIARRAQLTSLDNIQSCIELLNRLQRYFAWISPFWSILALSLLTVVIVRRSYLSRIRLPARSDILHAPENHADNEEGAATKKSVESRNGRRFLAGLLDRVARPNLAHATRSGSKVIYGTTSILSVVCLVGLAAPEIGLALEEQLLGVHDMRVRVLQTQASAEWEEARASLAENNDGESLSEAEEKVVSAITRVFEESAVRGMLRVVRRAEVSPPVASTISPHRLEPQVLAGDTAGLSATSRWSEEVLPPRPAILAKDAPASPKSQTGEWVHRELRSIAKRFRHKLPEWMSSVDAWHLKQMADPVKQQWANHLMEAMGQSDASEIVRQFRSEMRVTQQAQGKQFLAKLIATGNVSEPLEDIANGSTLKNLSTPRQLEKVSVVLTELETAATQRSLPSSIAARYSKGTAFADDAIYPHSRTLTSADDAAQGARRVVHPPKPAKTPNSSWLKRLFRSVR